MGYPGPLRERLKMKFDLKIAKSFSKSNYYIAYGDEVLSLPNTEREKRSISTPRQERITKLIEAYKKEEEKEEEEGWIFLCLIGGQLCCPN